jgi:hypothetical protein
MVILECVNCGYRWVKRCKKPKQCPSCRTSYWDSEPDVRFRRDRPRSFGFMDIKAGQRYLYAWKDEKENCARWRAFKKAQALRPELRFRTTGQGLEVWVEEY